jgi:hypothetical protein
MKVSERTNSRVTLPRIGMLNNTRPRISMHAIWT